MRELTARARGIQRELLALLPGTEVRKGKVRVERADEARFFVHYEDFPHLRRLACTAAEAAISLAIEEDVK